MSSSQLTNSIIFQRGRLKPPTRGVPNQAAGMLVPVSGEIRNLICGVDDVFWAFSQWENGRLGESFWEWHMRCWVFRGKSWELNQNRMSGLGNERLEIKTVFSWELNQENWEKLSRNLGSTLQSWDPIWRKPGYLSRKSGNRTLEINHPKLSPYCSFLGFSHAFFLCT